MSGMTNQGQTAGRRSAGSACIIESGVSATTSRIYPRTAGAAIGRRRHGFRPLNCSHLLAGLRGVCQNPLRGCGARARKPTPRRVTEGVLAKLRKPALAPLH